MFGNILGQQKVKRILSGQIKKNKIAHAYIFIGQSGVGKRLMAVEFAKILNCITNDYSKTDIGACCNCISCKKITKNIHPDLHFIDFAKQAELESSSLENQKTLKIETIKYMQKEIAIKTREGRWKVFIISPAEKINAFAANSLLKTLEEPPKNTLIVLSAKHKERIQHTVISRCQALFFQPLRQDEILSWISANYTLDALKAQEIAKLSDGSVENAKKLIAGTEKNLNFLWAKLVDKKFYISDALEFSKNISKKGALEFIDAMMCRIENNFKIYQKRSISELELLNFSKLLLLRNINARIVLDNLFLGFLDLNKKYLDHTFLLTHEI
jgi:DNA polymerase-3 subunit delta'